jgi:DNA-binding SARP family transcriptional activator
LLDTEGTAEPAAGPGSAGIQLCVLGGLHARCGADVLTISAAKHRILLAALLMSANHVVSGEDLAQMIWDGAPPPSVLATTRGYVMRLRHRLGPVVGSRILTRSPGYLIQLADNELDLLQFSDLYRQAGIAMRRGAWETASTLLRDAISLWRGPALEDVPSDALRREHVPPLEEMRLQALDWRIDADLNLDRNAEIIPELQNLAVKYPLRERFHAHLMLALYRCGRQAESLACFQRARQLLIENLGVEPGAELRELHQRVLSADPGLVAGTNDGHHLARPGRQDALLVPRQLPSDVRHFVGRLAETGMLDSLAGEVARGGGAFPVVVVSGMAGIGKTALAVHWARRAAPLFPDGQLYVNLRGFDPGGSPLTPAEVIRTFLEALGVAAKHMPTSYPAREGLYRSMLAGLRMLIVLDNAREAGQVRPLLPGSPGSMVVVTSRRQLTGLIAAEGACPVTLDILTERESTGILARRLGAERVVSESQAVSRLIELCGRLPLALVIATARAAIRPAIPLTQLVSQLTDSRLRMDVLEADDSTTSVRAAFSWSYRQLTGPASGMFRLLAVHPGPAITVPAAASLAGVPLEQAHAQLSELSEAHLIVEQDAGRFCLHDLVRSFAAETAETAETADGGDENRGALGRVLDYYLHTACAADRVLNPARDTILLEPLQPGVESVEVAGQEEAFAWFDAEREAMLALVPLAAKRGFHTHAWQVPWAMVDFLERRGYWEDLVGTQRTALSSARQVHDPVAQARANRALGHACSQAGLMAEAEEYLAQALILFGQAGDAVGQARTHQDLSAMLDQRDRPAEALRHDQLALGIYTKAGHRAGQASALNAIGWLLARLEDYTGAMSYCARALDLYREVGNRRGEAAALDSLGYAHHHVGEHTVAITYFRESLGLFRELGDRYLEADVLIHLGDASGAAAGPVAACEAWREALGILEEVDHPDAAKVRAKLAKCGDGGG